MDPRPKLCYVRERAARGLHTTRPHYLRIHDRRKGNPTAGNGTDSEIGGNAGRRWRESAVINRAHTVGESDISAGHKRKLAKASPDVQAK